MPEEMEVGCARPTGGPVGEPADETVVEESKPIQKEISMIHVGEKVPDFVAPGYQKGKFIKSNCPTILASGPCSVFIRAISPSSELLKFRRSPKNIRISRNWASKCFP